MTDARGKAVRVAFPAFATRSMTSMSTPKRSAPHRVVLVDRHAWYQPTIEREVFKRIDAEVVVGWAGIDDRPREADAGYPYAGLSQERLSEITSGFVPPSITTSARVVEMAKGASAILVVRAEMTAEVMDALPGLRAIGRYGVGVDNIDMQAAAARNIAVINAPGFCAREVADHTMTLLLACSRKLRRLQEGLGRGLWGRDAASPMSALYRQTLGLVGFGQIGREVAARAAPFGLRILVHDPLLAGEAQRWPEVTFTDFHTLLGESDYVSLHLPLSAATQKLIGVAALARMKPGAYLINTSRGGLVDEPALIEALTAGRIAGAGLDVFQTEPLPRSSPLIDMENVVLSPHIGGLSDDSQGELRRTVATEVAQVLSRS